MPQRHQGTKSYIYSLCNLSAFVPLWLLYLVSYLMKKVFVIFPLLSLLFLGNSIPDKRTPAKANIITGADQTAKYLPYLKGKNVGMTINPSSLIGNVMSVDSLLKLGVKVVEGYGPEHGFRGGQEGAVKDGIDPKTGIPIISLYNGTNKHKPTKEDLAGVDVMVFDMQEVGVRFFTRLAILQYTMEACAENNIELIVLDRPNPNGSLIDGPILEPKFKSLVGMNPIPILHGLTFGEYANMINGEGWLTNRIICNLRVIKMKNYEHAKPYTVPVRPSPNLTTQQSILLYPSLCWFEGTPLSVGRGTDFPFQVLGSPALKGKYTFSFKLNPGENGAQPNAENYGLDLRNYDTNLLKKTGRLNISWLREIYNAYPDKEKFFNNSRFDNLVGTSSLREQIIAGKTDKEIRDSWEPGLSRYKELRKKYLLYK
jgi:uncharacterized protein YbbC (DUF1343 family)